MMGEILFEKKDYKEAVRNFFKVAYGFGYPQAPEPIQKWQANSAYEAGRCFEVLKMTAQAKKSYQEVVDKYPNSDKAPLAKARLEGSFEPAAAAWERAGRSVTMKLGPAPPRRTANGPRPADRVRPARAERTPGKKLSLQQRNPRFGNLTPLGLAPASSMSQLRTPTVEPPPRVTFDEQLWPINVALVVLAGFVAGSIVALSGFDDPRGCTTAGFGWPRWPSRWACCSSRSTSSIAAACAAACSWRSCLAACSTSS